jgi:hypothetical protein
MDSSQQSEIYAGFDSLLEPQPTWRIGEFPERDGSMRQLREPDAVTIVQSGRLSIGVRRFTRTHDRVQILDNAKHVLFSTRTFEIPEAGSISFSGELRAEGAECRAGDLYDAFASLLCLDLSTGTAIDVFCRDDMYAAVFARLPFPGVRVPDLEPFKYWAIFDERVLPSPGTHNYGIEIAPGAGSITWTVDGGLLRRQSLPGVPSRLPRPRLGADDREDHRAGRKRVVSRPGPQGGMGADHRRAPPLEPDARRGMQ